MDNVFALETQVYASHWGHLAIILLWVAGTLFHVGWQGNYDLWLQNPVAHLPIAHAVWDPHQALQSLDTYAAGGGDCSVLVSHSGLYNWLYAAGFEASHGLYTLVLLFEVLAVLSLLLGKLHLSFAEDHLLLYVRFFMDLVAGEVRSRRTELRLPARLLLACFDASGARLNFHIAALLDSSSVAWAGHLIHVATPVSRGCQPLEPVSEPGLSDLIRGNWLALSLRVDQVAALSRTKLEGCKPSACLTFLTGFKSDTGSLYLTDLAHHHLGVGILLLWAGHLYATLWKGVGHRVRDLLLVHGTLGRSLQRLGSSLHLQLSLALTGLSVLSSLTAQHTYSLNPLPYLTYEVVSYTALYVHHTWIAACLMLGGFAHATLFLLRDYSAEAQVDSLDIVYRILSHKSALLSHEVFRVRIVKTTKTMHFPTLREKARFRPKPRASRRREAGQLGRKRRFSEKPAAARALILRASGPPEAKTRDSRAFSRGYSTEASKSRVFENKIKRPLFHVAAAVAQLIPPAAAVDSAAAAGRRQGVRGREPLRDELCRNWPFSRNS